MTKSTKRFIALGLLASLAISLSACSTTKTFKPPHKAATAACLITSKTDMPGSPTRQLAADLVEAQVVYGIKVREVAIPAGANVDARLLTELQGGCVLLVSSNQNYLGSLTRFAQLHSKIMVLFVGGQLSEGAQPSNFRWVADNPALSARLAGFASVEKGDDVTVLYSENYFQATSFISSFRVGVAAGEQVYDQVHISYMKVTSKADFLSAVGKLAKPSTVVALVPAGFLKAVPDFTGLELVGSDLQLGDTLAKYDPQIFASVERKTTNYVLSAVSSLLARKVSSDPKYRVLGGLNELSFTGTPSDQFLKYLSQLTNITP